MIDNPLVKQEIDLILNTRTSDVFWRTEVIVVANNRRLKVQNLLSRTLLRDYESQYGDEHYTTVQLGMSTYKDYVLPYKDNLKMEVIRYLVSEKGEEVPATKRIVKTYCAFLINPPNLELSLPSRGYDNPMINEVSQLLRVSFQLVESKLMEMRLADVSGMYSKTRPLDLLRHLLAYGLGETKSADTLKSARFDGVRGVDSVPAHNTKSYNHIIVPTGTRLTQLANFLQKEKGIYSTGINRYYQDGYWYVFPLYDHLRFTGSTKRLTLYNVPKGELISPERSYRVANDDIIILATGNTLSLDETEEVSYNQGTGIRFTRADSLIDGMTKTSGNKAAPNTKHTNQAFSIEDKPTGLTNARHSSRGVTDNPYIEASELSKGLGIMVTVNWENAKSSLLFPGMPVKFFYEKEGQLKEALGTLLGVRETEAPSTSMLTDNIYLSNCSLVLHLQKIK